MDTKLIVFCGIDGTGKTTQAKMLKDKLEELGYNVLLTSLITRSSDFFRRIDEVFEDMDWKTYCELIAFERYKNIKDLIDFNSNQFDLIILDRYMYTDLAYSKAYGCQSDFIKKIVDKAPKPIISILFNVNVSVAIERINKRGDIWSVQENIEILTKAHTEYLNIADRYNLNVINSNKDINLISNEVLEKVKYALKERDKIVQSK